MLTSGNFLPLQTIRPKWVAVDPKIEGDIPKNEKKTSDGTKVRLRYWEGMSGVDFISDKSR